jgi:hypothetical protein
MGAARGVSAERLFACFPGWSGAWRICGPTVKDLPVFVACRMNIITSISVLTYATFAGIVDFAFCIICEMVLRPG